MGNYFQFLKGQNKLERLRRFNFIMGFLHLIQGIAMVFLAIFVIEKLLNFNLKLYNFISPMMDRLMV